MKREIFQAWLAEADGLSPRQREEAARVLAEPASLAAVLALLEARIDEARHCPHRTTEEAVIRGRSNGLKRYGCKGCGKTFNALTGTSLARLRKKELWAAFAAGLGDGDTVKGAAARCGVADTTSFRWRHRFLAAVKAGAIKLEGIVEADETPKQPAVCWPVAKGLGSSTASRASGAASRKNATSPRSRCRSWSSPEPRWRSQRHHVHGCAARHHGCHHQGPPRSRHRARCAPGHRRRPVLPALRPNPGPHPPAARPKSRRAPPRRATPQQPSTAVTNG
jgi:transposase-like protein